MAETNFEQLASRFPHIKNVQNPLLVSLDEGKLFRRYPTVTFKHPGNELKNLSVSENLLTAIATDPKLFFAVRKIFEDQTQTELNFFYEEKNLTLGSLSISRYEILRGLELMLQKQDREDLSQLSFAYAEFCAASSVQGLKQLYKDSLFAINIEGKDLLFEPANFIELLTCSTEEFNNFLANYDENVHGTSLEGFMYALCEFAVDDNIFSRAQFAENQVDRFRNIFTCKTVDFEHINELVETNNPYLSQVQLNPVFEEHILGLMPEGYTDLQKAQYIYLKMCQTLTYDTEYYAVNQRGPRSQKHKSISYVKNITPDNNQAVCYEFSVMYAKLLEKVAPSITHELIFKDAPFDSGVYGKQHTHLELRCGKHLFFADSIRGIFGSDLTMVKTDREINGLYSRNLNKETVKEFRDSLAIVREDLKQQTLATAKGSLPTTFAETKQEYQQTIENDPTVTVAEKLNFVLGQIEDSKMQGLDAYAYLLQLKKIVFTKQECDKNIQINLLRSETFKPEIPAETTALITLSEDYNDDYFENTYLTYTPEAGVEEIPQEQLVEAFNNGTLSYISLGDQEVPGIDAPVCKLFIINDQTQN